MNEGLEKLGERTFIEGRKLEGRVFSNTAIESIRFPSTLKRIEAGTLYNCMKLRSVEIADGVEYIGDACFDAFYEGNKFEEIVLPGTLKEMGEKVFDGCDNLRVVWVEDGCTIDTRKYIEICFKVRRK